MIDETEFVSETVQWVPNTPTNPTQFLTPTPFAMRLRSQRTAIRGVSVDCEQSPATVTVYAGTSAQGPGVVVQPGTARAFGVENSSAIYLVFGTSTFGGYARITAFAVPTVAFGMATGAPALTAAAQRLEARAHHIVNLLEQILAKIP